MKKTTTLILFFISFLLSKECTSQSNFSPPGAEWNFYFNGFGGSGIEKFKYQKDTIVNNLTYKKIVVKSTVYSSTIPHVRNSFRLFRVFNFGLYELSSNKENFLWLVNSKKGDTYSKKSIGSVNDFVITVDSTKNVLINGVTVKKTWVTGISGNYKNEEIIYDNISPVDGFNYYLCWGYVLDCSTPLLCTYKDDVTNELKFNNSCDKYLSSTNEKLEKWDFLVSPNPCTDLLKINLSNVNKEINTINIYNALGQIVISSKAESYSIISINTSDLAKGYYWGKINGKDGTFNNFQFIKE